MKHPKALLFDVGNTLVFANTELTLAPLAARGIRPSLEQLHAAERAAKRFLDRAIEDRVSGADRLYWQVYYEHLLEALQLRDPDLVSELVAATRVSRHWDVVHDATRAFLQWASAAYPLAVISNADGTVAQQLDHLGIGQYFTTIVDSGAVGHEKPSAEIFHIACKRLHAQPADCLYVGDILSVDYRGARAAGIEALLLDVAGVYRGEDVPRIESLEELKSLL